MRLRSALAFVTLLALASPARAAFLQDLGTFEDGTFGGWQQVQWSLGPECGWVVNGGPEGWLTSTTGYEASGAFQAMCDQDLPYSTTVLYRDFTVPATADSLLLRLWYVNTVPGFVGDMPSLDPGGQGQGLRVDLMSPAQPVLGMAGILASPFVTSYPGNAADFRAPFTLRMGVAAWRGQTVRLRIAAMANTGNMNVGVDDVRIEGAQFVEVATGLPDLRDGAAEWGDYDADGDLDLAIMGHNGTGAVSSIWRNDAGAFAKLLDLPIALSSGDLAWLDTDRDGDLDLFATGRNAAGLPESRLGTNLGGGAFAWTVPACAQMNGNISAADADADGDTDIVMGWLQYFNVLRSGDGVATSPEAPGMAMDSAWVAWDAGPLPSFVAQGSLPATHTGIGGQWSNQGGGTSFPFYTSNFFSGPSCTGFVMEYGDADADGTREVYWSGRVPALGHLMRDLVRGYGLPAIPHAVPALYDAFARWIDVDSDGDLDLFLGGNDGANRYTGLHLWGADALVAADENFVQVHRAACAVGDYDGDGDPDLLVLGDGAGGPTTRLYRNTVARTNAAPQEVWGVWNDFSASSLSFTAGISTDDHTGFLGLNYNLRAGTTPRGVDLIAPDSDPLTGHRRVSRIGNTNVSGHRTYTLLWPRLLQQRASAIYYSGQAIDGSGIGGAWCPDAVLHLGGRVAAATDVPGDQGGQVRLRIAASAFETAGSSPVAVTSYMVWQRIDAAAQQAAVARAAARTAPAGEAGALPAVTVGGRTFLAPAAAAAAGFPAGTWEAVASVSALQQAEYHVRVATTADSGATGPHWSAYVITTHTDTPSVWWASPADSGKSVDNIAPGVPQGLAAQYHTGSGNALAWQPSADTDFQYFRVYRGDTPGFAISPATLAANTASTSWHDPAYDQPGVFYKLTAVDHNGNESLAASPGAVTAADAGPGPAFALAPLSPSPFAGSTRLAFSLPSAADVALEVFDAGGRRVRTLAHGRFAAGAHELAWDGRGEDGAPAAAGVLFVRLRAGTHEAVRRVVSLGGAR